MNEGNERKSPYTNSLSNLITICENSLKKLNRKQNTVKITSSIIMSITLIGSFTIFRPIMHLALIGSSFINLATAYKLKKQLYNISEHQKAITTIKKFVNLEIELDKKKKINGNIIAKFTLGMNYLTDLYKCFQTNNIKLLSNITKKYEKKFNDNLIIFNHKNSEENDQPIVKPNNQDKNDLPYNTRNYFIPNNKKDPINGYQYVKKIL